MGIFHHHGDEGHTHGTESHGHPPSAFGRAFLIAFLINFIFSILEAISAVYADSVSLMSDAAHNFADVLGLAFAWSAHWLMHLPPTERYSYGYKRSTLLAATANALILAVISGVIVYDTVLRFVHPEAINTKIVFVMAILGILVNGGTALLFRVGSKTDLNLRGAFLHLWYDALISLGVVITAGLIHFTGWLVLDALVGSVIVLVIVYGTWGFMRDIVNLLLDGVPSHINFAAVLAYLNSIPGVTAVHDLHIWGLSTREVALTAHLVMPGQGLSDDDFLRVDRELAEKYLIHHVTLQVEQGNGEMPCQLTSGCAT